MGPLETAQMYYRVFATVEGAAVLRHLEAVFLEPDAYVAGDPYGTHVRAGEQRVVRHIKGLLAVAQNPNLLLEAAETEPPDEAA